MQITTEELKVILTGKVLNDSQLRILKEELTNVLCFKAEKQLWIDDGRVGSPKIMLAANKEKEFFAWLKTLSVKIEGSEFGVTVFSKKEQSYSLKDMWLVQDGKMKKITDGTPHMTHPSPFLI